MPHARLDSVLSTQLEALDRAGSPKRDEAQITSVVPGEGDQGPRIVLAGESDRTFLRMNSNGYLGMAHQPEVIEAEEAATRAFGAGPGAVRFISGTYQHHVELERRLAAFHGRDAAMIFSSAYAAVLGALVPLISAETAVLSDELNHNCIINAMRMARPMSKAIYGHLDLGDLEQKLEEAASEARRAIVVTDGIFSMRGDHAPLTELMELAQRHNERFPEDLAVVVDDSHGVGALGETGRGTEEHTGASPADLLVATLGKALGVNGGYVVSSRPVIDYLRETSPLYVFSNPITVGEAAAALAALDLLEGRRGRELLRQLRAMTRRFEQGLVKLGYETIPGEHPVVPLMVRDTARTASLAEHLYAQGVLATGLNYPVVPRGDEEIRFQISAEHTPADIDYTLQVLADFPGREVTTQTSDAAAGTA